MSQCAMHNLRRLAIASIALAACAWGAATQPFVDRTQAGLINAVPELSTLAFDSDQSTLQPLLDAAGQQLQTMFANFVNVSMSEEVHEMRFDSPHLIWKDHRDRFRYVIETRPFVESRRQARGPNAAQPNAKSIFLIAGPFVEILGDLLPQNQKQARFRYLGRMSEDGRPSLYWRSPSETGREKVSFGWMKQENGCCVSEQTS